MRVFLRSDYRRGITIVAALTLVVSMCLGVVSVASAAGDTTPPVTTSNVRSAYWGTAAVSLTATDTGGSGVASTYYQVDSSPDFSSTGGTKTTSGGNTIVTFKSSGTLVCSGSVRNATVLLVGGGGGGGAGKVLKGGGGGAGAVITASGVTLSGSMTISVGAGGAGGPASSSNGSPGGVTSMSGTGVSLSAAGGGYGARASAKTNGGNGACGGGGGNTGNGGIGSVGYNGGWGDGVVSGPGGGGGGGGMGGVGGAAGTTTGGNGGVGVRSSISGAATYYGGGGGGGYSSSGGTGGAGGGGAGRKSIAGAAGVANTGGGGGGGGTNSAGGAGGSGIVIISFPTPTRQTGTTITVAGPTSGVVTHSIHYWSVDVAGNTEAVHTAPFTVTVPDTIAPTTASDAQASYSSTATIHLSATDGGISGLAGTYYRLDGGAQTAGTVITVAPPTSGTATHTVTFWSVDNAGNVESSHAAAFTVAGPTSASLLWSDEFDGTALNTADWTVATPWGNTTNPKANELEHYYPANVTANGGNLQFKTSNLGTDPDFPYESGAISSLPHDAFGYGYYEIRAKLPKGQGIWPAFWMVDTGAETSHEIDIFELLGNNPNKVYMTYHVGNNQVYDTSFTGPDFSAGYHNFAVDWQPTSITWYIDGVQRGQYTGTVLPNPLCICANTAVGGDWGGAPDTSTVFPQHYNIDYIRVYDSKPVYCGNPPTGVANAYSTPYATTLNVAAPGVLSNDTDAEGNSLTATLSASPKQGTLTLSANGAFSYTPYAGFSGIDSFRYRAYDGANYSAETTVTLTVAAPPPGTLMYNDDFNGPLDTSVWANQTLWGGTTDGGLQNYDPANCSFSGGNMLLKTELRSTGGMAYTSAIATTLNRPTKFGYGYYEMQAKLPKGAGIWPNWLLSNDGSLEIAGASQFGSTPGTNMKLTMNETQVYNQTYAGTPDLSTNYHVFAFDWQPTYVKWYVDNTLRGTYTGSVPVPTDKAMNMTVYTAVGSWAGNPDGTTVLPQNFTIDYIREYSTKP